MTLLICLGGNNRLGAFHGLGILFQLHTLALALLGAMVFLVGNRPNVRLVCSLRQALRKQIIPCVSHLHFDNVAEPAKLLYVLTKQNLHHVCHLYPLYSVFYILPMSSATKALRHQGSYIFLPYSVSLCLCVLVANQIKS